jgi:hypothetical protein
LHGRDTAYYTLPRPRSSTLVTCPSLAFEACATFEWPGDPRAQAISPPSSLPLFRRRSNTPDIAQHSRSLTTHPDAPPPRHAQLHHRAGRAERNALRGLSWPTGIPTAASQHKSAQQAQKRELSGDAYALFVIVLGLPAQLLSTSHLELHARALASTPDHDDNPASSARAYPPSQHDRTGPVYRRPSTSAPRQARAHQPVSSARASSRRPVASASIPAQTSTLRKSPAPQTLTATTAGRAQRHWRVREQRHKGPHKPAT